jgi:hypothetical protein
VFGTEQPIEPPGDPIRQVLFPESLPKLIQVSESESKTSALSWVMVWPVTGYQSSFGNFRKVDMMIRPRSAIPLSFE